MKYSSQNLNKYQIACLLIIVSMCTGTEFFGSYQPVRLLLIAFFLWFLPSMFKEVKNVSRPIWAGIGIFVIWLLYGFISLQWSPDPIVGLKSELIVMSIGFTALPLFSFLIKKIENPFDYIRKLCLLCFAIMALVSLFEITTSIHFASSEPSRVIGRHDVAVPHTSTTFGNVNDYGAFLMFLFPFLLWGVLEAKTVKQKYIYFTAFLLNISFILINGNRMGLLVIIIQMLCFLLLLKDRIKKEHIKKRYIILLLLLLIAFFFAPRKYNPFYAIRYRMATVLHSSDESSNERIKMIKSGINMLKDSHGMGIGAGGFEASVLQKNPDANIINPHNLFVEIFAQYGIGILLLLCSWLAYLFYYARHNAYLSSKARTTVYAIIVSFPLIGAMPSAFLGYTFLWVFLSIVAAIAAYKLPNTQSIKI